MKIQTSGLLGLGRFGQMIYRYLQGNVPLRVFDSDPQRLKDIPEASPLEKVVESDALILAVPISAVKELCRQIAPRMRAGQILIDTCSVKARPVQWMLDCMPEEVQILGTHPLFGPDSGKDGIEGLRIAMCPVRIEDEPYSKICDFLRSLGLVLIETTPEEHDEQIGQSQAIFHLIAQTVKRLGWGVRPISTMGPEIFYRLVRTVQNDTEELFRDMERENPYAPAFRRQFIQEMMEVDRELAVGRSKASESLPEEAD